MRAIQTVGQFCSTAYKKMNDHDKRRFVVAFDELTENLEKVAADPTFIPQYTTEVYDKDTPSVSDLSVHGQPAPRKSLFWASEKVLGWASQILEGLDNYYLCRDVFLPSLHAAYLLGKGGGTRTL